MVWVLFGIVWCFGLVWDCLVGLDLVLWVWVWCFGFCLVLFGALGLGLVLWVLFGIVWCFGALGYGWCVFLICDFEGFFG